MVKYTGKNVLRGYCKHFGVDWRCAALELERLGVRTDPEYLAKREEAEAALVRQRKARKEHREAKETPPWHPYNEPLEAYLAGDFSALLDLEQRQADGDEGTYNADDVPF